MEDSLRIFCSSQSETIKNESPGNDKVRETLDSMHRLYQLLVKFHVLFGCLFVFLGTNYAFTFLDLFAGRSWSSRSDAVSALQTFLLYIPFMGVNGVTEAVLLSVARESDLKAYQYWMVAFSGIFMAAGAASLTIFYCGTSGIIAANILNMALRITCGVVFLRRVWQKTRRTSSQSRAWMPSVFVILIGCVVWIITRTSAGYADQMRLKGKFEHVAVGGICGILFLLSM